MPGNKAAIGQHYNAASDRYISHDGVVHALAEVAGVEANIVHYDTKAVSLAKVSLSCLSSCWCKLPLAAMLAEGCPLLSRWMHCLCVRRMCAPLRHCAQSTLTGQSSSSEASELW